MGSKSRATVGNGFEPASSELRDATRYYCEPAFNKLIRADTLFKRCWKTAEGTKIVFEDLSRNVSGFKKKTGQQCSGKNKKLGWIIGRLNTIQEKLVEVGRNGRFLKPWMLF